jgi:hypothetical protein
VNKHFKKALNYSIAGSLSVVVVSAISGCQDKSTQEQYNQSKNMFFVIEEKPKGSYKIAEQYPTNGETRAVLKEYNGKERVINEQEIKALMQQEVPRIQDGSSNLTNNNSGGGMSLGETIMAAAGGALLGSMIGNAMANKLNNNRNFQNKAQSSRRNSSFTRGVNSRPKATSTRSSRGGFFNSRGSSRTRGGFFGG